jgi:hypothetical protein
LNQISKARQRTLRAESPMHGREMFSFTFLANSYTGTGYKTHTFVISIDKAVLVFLVSLKIYTDILDLFLLPLH